MSRDPAPEAPAGPGPSGAVLPSVLDAVLALRAEVARVSFPLDVPGADRAAAERDQGLAQLDDHLVPRLRDLSSPAVAVVAGSTGAGKSSIVNSLIGEEVSPAGVLRPTTRRPVLVHHPADADLLADHPLREAVEFVAHEAARRGLVVIDAPDLDSVETANRALARRLLEAADLWLFTTTATRYGDALPWEVLATAAERGTATAVVLNRVPTPALPEIRRDLMGRLRDLGLTSVPLFVLADQGAHEGLLDTAQILPLRRWLTMVARPHRARTAVARTQRGALAGLGPWVRSLAEAVEDQVRAAAELSVRVDAAVADAAERTADQVLSGAVAIGAVRGRWAQAGAAGVRPAPPRRGRHRRTEALEAVTADLLRALTAALTTARAEGHRAVAGALAHPDAAGAGAVAEAMRRADAADVVGPTPADSAEAWLAAVGEAFATLEHGPGARAVARLRRRLGDRGATTVAAAAAAGLGPAGALLVEALGRASAERVVTTGAADLARRAEEQATAAAAPARALLADPALAEGADVDLRLRLAAVEGVA